jgi:hypothetical protein
VLHGPRALRDDRIGGAGEVEQMGTFGVVELERPGESFEHQLGDAADVARSRRL